MDRVFFSSGRRRRRVTFRPQLEVLENCLAPRSLHGMGHSPMNDDDDDDQSTRPEARARRSAGLIDDRPGPR